MGSVSLENPDKFTTHHIIFTTEFAPSLSACSIICYGFPLKLCWGVFFSKSMIKTKKQIITSHLVYFKTELFDLLFL